MCRQAVCCLSLIAISCFLGTTAPAQGLGVTGDLITGIDGSRSLRVRSVVLGGLAHRLGVAFGDQIISINGHAPGDALTNQRAIAMGAGRLSVVVNRRGAVLQLSVRNSLTVPPVIIDPRPRQDSRRYPQDRPQNNDAFRRAGPDLLVDLEEIRDVSGHRVRVRSVTPGGRGQREGLRAGDIIDTVNGVKIRSLRDVRNAYYYRAGTITITYLRGAAVQRIVLRDRDVTRKTLGITTVMTQKREVKVTGADPKGLGSELGIAQRGTVITRVNGSPIKTPADIKRLDQAIVEGRVTRLEVEFIPPGGRPQVARRGL